MDQKELETLLIKLQNSKTPLDIIIKAFSLGYKVKLNEAKIILNIINNRKVRIESNRKEYIIKDNEYIDSLNNKEELLEDIKLINKRFKNKQFNINNYKYYLEIKNKKETSNHLIHNHDYDFYKNYIKCIKLAKQNKLVINNGEDLKKLHKLLFNDGEYSKEDNHLYSTNSKGEKVIVYNCALASEKEQEVNKAFEIYKDAINKNKELTLVYEICLIEKLFYIHPFIDGNGRTLRLMLLIRLYMLGHENIFDFSIEYNRLLYLDYYLMYSSPRTIEQRRNNIVVNYGPIIQYNDFIHFMCKLLINGQ